MELSKRLSRANKDLDFVPMLYPPAKSVLLHISIDACQEFIEPSGYF